MTSVCLALIVRDTETQGKDVARCIASARAWKLVDRAVIIDTGSVDNTKSAVLTACKGIPLTLLDSEWQGHAPNRTELLARARESEADYTLMLDADMEFVIEGEIPELDRDEYLIPIRDRGLIYPLPLLTSTAREFYYAGVAHSYLACRNPPENGTQGALLDMVALLDHGGGGASPGKIERDAKNLAAEVGKNPGDRRSWFYLAQSYRDLDRVEEAIWAYKVRAGMGGWDEEVYQALYQAGALLCTHVNYYQGAKLLIAAAEMKPNRAEALRALAGCSTSVANKLPFPKDEVLFVEPGAYRPPIAAVPSPPEMPPLPDIKSARRRRRKGAPILPSEISAIIVTRGNVDLEPILETLPYDDVIVWDNSQREIDYKIFGRYAAIPEAKHPVIYWQDDDIIFRNHDALLAAYQPGVAIANMDDAWIEGAGYEATALFGAGSLCDAHLPAEIFGRYLEEFPWDDDLMTNPDIAFGTLVNWFRADFGYEVRPFADDPDRLYLQPGQTERKHALLNRCLEMMKTAA